MPRILTLRTRFGLVEDAANGASAHSRQTQVRCMCEQKFSHGEARLQQCATETLNALTFMPTVSMEEFRKIMSYTQSTPLIRKQLNSLPVNATVSSGLLQAQRLSHPLLQTRIKPPLLVLLMMSRTCLDVRRHSAWMTRS